MFKSIRWKITVIFVLLVLATELFIGGFNILGVMKHYHDDFSNSINEVFTEDIKNDLLAAANEISIPAESTDTSIVRSTPIWSSPAASIPRSVTPYC